eukprot:8179131-Pyramimonas_sp.AAC.1
MPAVVPHSDRFPYMAMARWETGGGGNLHAHGFSVGLPSPQVGRVMADVDGEGDMAPSTSEEDLRAVLRWLWREGGAAEWEAMGEMSSEEVREELAAVLGRVSASEVGLAGAGAPVASGAESASAESEGSDQEGSGEGARLSAARVQDLLDALVQDGSLVAMGGEAVQE